MRRSLILLINWALAVQPTSPGNLRLIPASALPILRISDRQNFYLPTRPMHRDYYTRETFPVLEMTCAACAISVESMLRSVAGVADAGVNFANQTAWVQYDDSRVTPEK